MSLQTANKPGAQPLIIDGLNCAAVTREQFERTLKGGISAINLTAVEPWSDLPKSLKELEANLSKIEVDAGYRVSCSNSRGHRDSASRRQARGYHRGAELADGRRRHRAACNLQAARDADPAADLQ